MITDKIELAERFLETAKAKRTAAIILAAGNSTRMGSGINKQLEELCGVPVLGHTLMAYQKCKLIREIVVVTRPQNFEDVYELAKKYEDPYK